MPCRVLFCRANSIAPEPRVEKEARTLACAGYPVTALGWDMDGKHLSQEDAGGLQINRLRILGSPARGLGNLPNLLRWQVGLFSWLAKHHGEYDLIHACDFDTILPALACKLLWKKRVVYDIFDFYADMLRQTPAPLVKMLRLLELKAIDWADAVILADESRIRQIAGSHPRRYAIIYNSPEEDSALTAPAYPRPENSQLHIAYVGNLMIQRGLLILLELLQRHPEWTLDLAGYGPDKDLICAAARKLPNVVWHGHISYALSLQLSRRADVMVATFDPSIPNHRFSSSNKLFEAMLLGKPILVARGTSMDGLVEQFRCGLVVSYGRPEELENALLGLQADPDLRRRLGEHGRQAYDSEFSWSRMQARLLGLYREVAAECA